MEVHLRAPEWGLLEDREFFKRVWGNSIETFELMIIFLFSGRYFSLINQFNHEFQKIFTTSTRYQERLVQNFANFCNKSPKIRNCLENSWISIWNYLEQMYFKLYLMNLWRKWLIYTGLSPFSTFFLFRGIPIYPIFSKFATAILISGAIHVMDTLFYKPTFSLI